MTQDNSSPIFCSACGQKNVGDASFCSKCGKQIASTVTAQPPPSTTTPANPNPEGSAQKTSGIATAIAVVGFVFGLIGMLGSFIPIIGIFTIKIGIAAALISLLSIVVAYSQNASRTFPIVALTISLIGVAIVFVQINKIESATKTLKNLTEEMRTSQPQQIQQPSDSNQFQIQQRDERIASMRAKAEVVTKTLGTYKCINETIAVGDNPIANGEAVLTDVDVSYVHVYPNEAPYRVKVIFAFSNIKSVSKLDARGVFGVKFDLKNDIWIRSGDMAVSIWFQDMATRDELFNNLVEAKANWDRMYPELI